MIRRTSPRPLTILGGLLLSLVLAVGLAQPATAAEDYAISHVQPRAHAWSLTQTVSGSCYLENGVTWSTTVRWNFGYTARPSVRLNSVTVSYRISQGGWTGATWLQDANGRTVWESGYNSREVRAGTVYTQTFDTGSRVVTQGPNGVTFQSVTRPGNCGGSTIRSIFNVRSL